jgi:hypothetical protein
MFLRRKIACYPAEKRVLASAVAALVFVCVTGYPAAAAPSPKTARIPDLAGANRGWQKAADDFQPPPAGPGPITFSKDRPYVPNNDRGEQVTVRIADLTNPILKPWAIERMRKANEDAAAGKEAFEARASCRPGGVPGFLVMGRVNPLYFIQAPKEVVMINEGGPEVRRIYINVPHSRNPKASAYGESVGHYEGGNTLVIDTIGLSDDTFVDNYRTPHTTALHVVERYTLADDGKTLNVSITVEDPGTFNMAWSARQTYRRTHEEPMLETICSENNSVIFDAAVSPIPQAGKPDF